jgi:hypothetical protein
MRQFFIKSKREHGSYSYSKAQKLVCLRALQLVNIYDDMLFANFIKDVDSALKDGVEDHRQGLKSCGLSLHPITAIELDRSWEVLDVLDFASKHHNLVQGVDGEPLVPDALARKLANLSLQMAEDDP